MSIVCEDTTTLNVEFVLVEWVDGGGVLEVRDVDGGGCGKAILSYMHEYEDVVSCKEGKKEGVILSDLIYVISKKKVRFLKNKWEREFPLVR